MWFFAPLFRVVQYQLALSNTGAQVFFRETLAPAKQLSSIARGVRFCAVFFLTRSVMPRLFQCPPRALKRAAPRSRARRIHRVIGRHDDGLRTTHRAVANWDRSDPTHPSPLRSNCGARRVAGPFGCTERARVGGPPKTPRKPPARITFYGEAQLAHAGVLSRRSCLCGPAGAAS